FSIGYTEEGSRSARLVSSHLSFRRMHLPLLPLTVFRRHCEKESLGIGVTTENKYFNHLIRNDDFRKERSAGLLGGCIGISLHFRIFRSNLFVLKVLLKRHIQRSNMLMGDCHGRIYIARTLR